MKNNRNFVILLTIFVGSIFLFIQIARSADSDIVINEICPRNCASKEKQWLEIYNKGENGVDIAGWNLFVEGESLHGIDPLMGQSSVIPSKNYAVIVFDTSTVFSNWAYQGLLFDSTWERTLTPGTPIGLQCKEGNILIEQPFNFITSTGNSLERVNINSSSWDLANWQENPSGNTIGQINYWINYIPPVAEVTSTGQVSTSTTTTVDITTSTPVAENSSSTTFPILYINEFLPDPAIASDTEWIEIYNPTTSSVDLTGWTIWDSTGERDSSTGTILAQDFLVLELSSVLNNTGDTIILKNPSSTISDQIVYGTSSLSAPDKGNSLARSVDGAGSWQETTALTKSYENIINAPYHPLASSGQASGGSGTVQINTQIGSGQIIINELFPNPKGSDTENEFIELKNVSQNDVNLQDWIISDSTTKYKIKEGYLGAGGILFLKRFLTNISLNNSGMEEVKLFNPAGALMDSIKYTGNVDEEMSYSRKGDNTWEWSSKSTPGGNNIFVAQNLPPIVLVNFSAEIEVGETIVFDASDSVDPDGDSLNFIWTVGSEKKSGEILKYIFDRAGDRIVNLAVDDSKGNKVEKKLKINVVRTVDNDENNIGAQTQANTKTLLVVKKASTKYQPIINITLDKIRDLELDDRVKVSGVVAVEPGILGSQYFYIVGSSVGSTSSPQATSISSGQAGVQIYSNKKDFPDLKVGDKIEAIGDLSESYGERRVKVKTKSDIKIISKNNILNPQTVEISEVGEDVEGALVMVEGEVTEAKATYLYLDDGTEEIKIALKKGTGLVGTNYLVGEKVQINGLVGQTKDGYQIMPRNVEDIVKIAEAPLLQSASSTSSQAQVAETYLTATAGGLTSILIGLFAKARGRLVWNIAKKTGLIALKLIRRSTKV